MDEIRFYLTTVNGQAEVCFDYPGEIYGACAPDETAVQFDPDGPFVGVPCGSLKTIARLRLPRPGDSQVQEIERKISFCRTMIDLEATEATARSAGGSGLVAKIRALRKYLYVTEMSCPAFPAARAAAQFEANELRLAAEGQGAHGDGRSGGTA